MQAASRVFDWLERRDKMQCGQFVLIVQRARGRGTVRPADAEVSTRFFGQVVRSLKGNVCIVKVHQMYRGGEFVNYTHADTLPYKMHPYNDTRQGSCYMVHAQNLLCIVPPTANTAPRSVDAPILDAPRTSARRELFARFRQ